MEPISEQEIKSRRDTMASVYGTIAMEGQEPDAVTRALFTRWEEGALTEEQLGAAIEAHVADLVARLAEQRALAGAA